MSFLNDIKNRFNSVLGKVVNETLNDEYKEQWEQVSENKDMERIILTKLIDAHKYDGWKMQQSTDGVIIDDTISVETFYNFEQALEVYKLYIQNEISELDVLDSFGYYNFYLTPEELEYLGLSDDLKKQIGDRKVEEGVPNRELLRKQLIAEKEAKKSKQKNISGSQKSKSKNNSIRENQTETQSSEEMKNNQEIIDEFAYIDSSIDDVDVSDGDIVIPKENIMADNDKNKGKDVIDAHERYVNFQKQRTKHLNEKIEILELVQRLGGEIIEKKSSRRYKTISLDGHDSLVVYPDSNRFEYYSQVQQQGKYKGYTVSGLPVDFYMFQQNVKWTKALDELTEIYKDVLDKDICYIKEKSEYHELTPKERFDSLKMQLAKNGCFNEKNLSKAKAKEYLVQHRKIDEGIVDELIKNQFIYQTSKEITTKYGHKMTAYNVNFIGRDEFGLICSVSTRSTFANSSFKGDYSDCNYNRGWYYNPLLNSDRTDIDVKMANNRKLFVFEAPIDMMSYMSLLKETGYDYKSACYLSTCSATKTESVIETCKLYGFKEAVIMFDNDKAGIEAGNIVIENLEKEGIKSILKVPEANFKDWNERLISFRNEEQSQKKESQVNNQLQVLKNGGSLKKQTEPLKTNQGKEYTHSKKSQGISR